MMVRDFAVASSARSSYPYPPPILFSLHSSANPIPGILALRSPGKGSWGEGRSGRWECGYVPFFAMLPAALLGGKGERRGERRLLGDRGGEVWRSLMLGLAGHGQSGGGGAAVGRR
jgi:hypothetical protein